MQGVEERASPEIAELEALWELPPVREPQARRRRQWPAYRVFARSLLIGWAAFVVMVFAFEPAQNPDAQVPAWADGLVGAFWLALASAAFTGRVARRAGLTLSALAGALGLAVAYECRATGHHLGPFWLFELVGTAALLALSLAALARAARAGSAE